MVVFKLAAAVVAAIGLMAAATSVSAQADAGWTAELSLQYDSEGRIDARPGERRGPDTQVSGQTRWRIAQSLQATITYTQKVRGAVARGMPDAGNDQRYDAWLSRPRQGRQAAAVRSVAEWVNESAVRLGRADGEGAGELNRERAGKFGRVEHRREQLVLTGEGADAGELQGGGFIQFDRETGKLHVELSTPRPVAERLQARRSRVASIDKAAAADVWDEQQVLPPDQALSLWIAALPVLVFDAPKDASTFEVTQLVPVTRPQPGQVRVTLRLQRVQAAVAATARATPPTAPVPASATEAKAGTDCTKPGASGSAAAAGAEAGGQLLGGGAGRQVGAAIGGLLGALGGAPKPAGSADTCAR